MDIIVEGSGELFFKPNQIELSYSFQTKDKDYDNVLENGVKNVKDYIKLLEKLGFKKEDVKTRSFRVSEDKKYDETTRKYFSDGFVFNQDSTLKFDYDMERLSKLMEETSKLNNPPIYRIKFGVKDNKSVEEEVLALAYKDAEINAKAIAKASGKQVIDCKKVSFEPFTEDYYSRSSYGGIGNAKACCEKASASQMIQEVFVPEDVEVCKVIYCLFVAE